MDIRCGAEVRMSVQLTIGNRERRPKRVYIVVDFAIAPKSADNDTVTAAILAAYVDGSVIRLCSV